MEAAVTIAVVFLAVCIAVAIYRAIDESLKRDE